MTYNLIPLKDCTFKVDNWNPKVVGEETISYIDIASIDKDTKKIVNPTVCMGKDAPSRARQIVKENDVLVSTVRPNLNSVAVVTTEFDGATASTGYTVLRCKEEKLDYRYLFHWVKNQSFINEMVKLATGQSYPAVSDKIILESKIPLPPLSEQKRIAQILDKADELRQKRQQSIEKLDELLQATFIDMFGDPITNPKGWEICEVGKVTDCIVPARDKPKSFTGDIPWITTDDLNHLGFTETSKKNIGLTNEEITLAKARLIPKNSVVISCVGNLGLASIASDNFVMNQQLHSFQCGDKILPEFLIFCLPFQKGYMLSRATSTTVPYMNKSVCNSIPVTVPPLDLQKKWKLIFENSNKQKQVLKKQLAQQETLFQSLQQRAFNGEL